PLSCRCRLEQRLQIAVRPLTQRTLARDAATRIEGLAQENDESVPLFVGEAAIELDCALDAHRESEDAAWRRRCAVERLRGGCDSLGGDPDFLPNRLQLGECHAFA